MVTVTLASRLATVLHDLNRGYTGGLIVVISGAAMITANN